MSCSDKLFFVMLINVYAAVKKKNIAVGYFLMDERGKIKNSLALFLCSVGLEPKK